KAGGLFVRELPFLSQEEWDKNLYAQDILFVRGEDSLSRACLSGKPFVWQAYLQDGNYQLVKVRALLARMRPHFAPDDFSALEKFWLLYNGAEGFGKPKTAGAAMEEACYGFLKRSDKMKAGFEAFARSLFELGNFAEKLDEFVSLQEL
ncbi:MAG: elongation factor P maturation arginine rhamnosyltransferase EarP, partial [Treponema sp.]|nr:elongation factor P maturation arginine rhamnosyltransferase EarP [Treponema sp.]